MPLGGTRQESGLALLKEFFKGRDLGSQPQPQSSASCRVLPQCRFSLRKPSCLPERTLSGHKGSARHAPIVSAEGTEPLPSTPCRLPSFPGHSTCYLTSSVPTDQEHPLGTCACLSCVGDRNVSADSSNSLCHECRQTPDPGSHLESSSLRPESSPLRPSRNTVNINTEPRSCRSRIKPKALSAEQ